MYEEWELIEPRALQYAFFYSVLFIDFLYIYIHCYYNRKNSINK